MRDYRTIEIDLDIHKAIEAERGGFGETPNDILRRLLGLGAAQKPFDQASNVIPGPGLPEPGSWSGKGAVLPAGTDLRMTYNGETYIAVIDDGSWLINGQRFASPSGAASGVARTRDGKSVNLDGWEYWYFRFPGGEEWAPLKQLKQRKQA